MVDRVSVVMGVVVAATVGLGVCTQAASSSPPPPLVQPHAVQHVQDRTVVVVDHSHGWQGVGAAVAGWNRTVWLDMVLRDHCQRGRQCVVVTRPAPHPHRAWIGHWTPRTPTRSVVQLNSADRRSRGPEIQRWIACHELGHAVGLGEAYSGTPGCMVDDWHQAAHETSPTDRDLRMLDRVASGRMKVGSVDGVRVPMPYRGSALAAWSDHER